MAGLFYHFESREDVAVREKDVVQADGDFGPASFMALVGRAVAHPLETLVGGSKFPEGSSHKYAQNDMSKLGLLARRLEKLPDRNLLLGLL